MKERPILFSAPMVRALLSGVKTQTRRVFKAKNGGVWPNRNDLPGMRQVLRTCPYGKNGDRLWVREAFAFCCEDKFGPVQDSIIFRADEGNAEWEHGWRPSIHMPRAASRILLEIVSVRVERLQEISRGDAMAEGCPFANMADGDDPRLWYSDLWEQINGPGSWGANPRVWVVEFRRMS